MTAARNDVVSRLNVTAEYRKSSRSGLVLPQLQFTIVLSKRRSNMTDGADTEAQKVGLSVRRVPLKIPM